MKIFTRINSEKRKILSQKVWIFMIFIDTAKLSTINDIPVFSPSKTARKNWVFFFFNLYHPSVLSIFFYFCQPTRLKMISWWNFNLFFLNKSEVKHRFLCLRWMHFYISVNCLFESFIRFSTELFVYQRFICSFGLYFEYFWHLHVYFSHGILSVCVVKFIIYAYMYAHVYISPLLFAWLLGLCFRKGFLTLILKFFHLYLF